MTKKQNWTLFLTRISFGWLFFYAGITKVLNSEWSASGYLSGAKMFTGLFEWFASPAILPFTNFLNQWGLTLIGVSLLLGIWVRYSAIAGAVLMLLYYFPLGLPMPNPHSYIVDEHIIYFFGLILLAVYRAGHVWGLDKFVSKRN